MTIELGKVTTETKHRGSSPVDGIGTTGPFAVI